MAYQAPEIRGHFFNANVISVLEQCIPMTRDDLNYANDTFATLGEAEKRKVQIWSLVEDVVSNWSEYSNALEASDDA